MTRRTGIPPRVAITLQVAAVAAAAIAQSLVRDEPWWSVGGFALAGLLFVIGAGRASPRAGEVDSPAAPGLPGLWLWILLAAGSSLCASAAVALFLEGPLPVVHIVWLAGLATFAVAAVIADCRRWRRPAAADVAAWGLLLLVCGATFGWQLTGIPSEVHGDDAEVGIDALRLIQIEPFNLFRTSWFDLPIFHAAPTALGLKIFGVNLLGLRASSAILGTLTVLLLYALARRLWDREVALLAALLLASARFFIHLSRAGYHYVDTPLLSVLVLGLALTAWREIKLGAALWTGIALGLGVQTYYASRLVPFLLAATWTLWLIRGGREHRRERLIVFAVVVIVALATAAPIIAYFANHPEDLWDRTRATSILSDEAWPHIAYGNPGLAFRDVLLDHLQKAFTLFNATGDTSLQYGYRGPLVDPVSGVFFVLGAAWAVSTLARQANQVLLLWLLVPLIAGAALTIDAPFFPRISGILPFVAVVVALAMQRLLAAIRTAGFAAAVPGVAGLRGALAAGAFLLLAVAAVNVRTYFFDYAPSYRHGPALAIAEWIRDHGVDKTTYVLRGEDSISSRHGAIRFLTRGYTKIDVADLAEREKAGFDRQSVFVILPEAVERIPRLQQLAGPLKVQTHFELGRGVTFYTAEPAVDDQDAEEEASEVEPYGVVRTPLWAKVALLGLGAFSLLAWFFVASGGMRRPAVEHLLERLLPWRRRAGILFDTLFGFGSDDDRWQPPQRITLVALIAIGILAAGLRFYQLGSLPAGFYCDEAGLGYNVYSILQTGRDETGSFLPLFVWSFDTNFKNPIWIYSALLPIHLLGLNEFAVRLTSALYGTATVVAMFFLGRALMGRWVGLAAAFFLAISPWHLHFSRIAFELITFPFFFVLGVTCLIQTLRGKKRLIPAALLLGYSLYTYAIAKLFVPLFVAAVSFALRRELFRRPWQALAAALLFAITIAPVVTFDVSNRERAGHYFSDTTILGSGGTPMELTLQLVDHYARFFSPRFLFAQGDRNVRHTVRGMGELYLPLVPLLLIGLACAFLRRDPAMLILLWWLALYPVAASLQTEAPSASRGIIGAPAFCLLAAVGFGTILRLFANAPRRAPVVGGLAQLAVAGALLVIMLHQLGRYWRLYSEEYPLYAAKYYTGFQYGHREAMEYFFAHADEYDQMVLTAHLSNQAHIFPLFYGPFSPRSFQREKFDALRQEAKIQVGWVKDLDRFDQYPRLLFAVTDDELDQLPRHEVKHQIIAPDGTPALVLVALSPGEEFIRSWLVAGPYSVDDRGPPPATDPDAPTPSGDVWRPVTTEDSAVGLDDVFGPEADEACAWAVNYTVSRETRDIEVRAGFDDSGEVWINGQRIALEVDRRTDAPFVDALIGRAQLREGRNVVAVRSCEHSGLWYFYLRLTDTSGLTLRSMRWEF